MPAPSTPTDAQFTEVEDSINEVPTPATNFTNPGPPPGNSCPPPGLDSGVSSHPSQPQDDGDQLSQHAHYAATIQDRKDEISQWNILRTFSEEYRVTSIHADRAREAEQKAKRKFEDALLSAPKPGHSNRQWLAAYAACLTTEV